MRVRRPAIAINLAPKMVKIFFGQSSFEEGSCINSRCGMALDEDEVTAMVRSLSAPEMIESDIIKRRG